MAGIYSFSCAFMSNGRQVTDSTLWVPNLQANYSTKGWGLSTLGLILATGLVVGVIMYALFTATENPSAAATSIKPYDTINTGATVESRFFSKLWEVSMNEPCAQPPQRLATGALRPSPLARIASHV